MEIQEEKQVESISKGRLGNTFEVFLKLPLPILLFFLLIEFARSKFFDLVPEMIACTDEEFPMMCCFIVLAFTLCKSLLTRKLFFSKFGKKTNIVIWAVLGFVFLYSLPLAIIPSRRLVGYSPSKYSNSSLEIQAFNILGKKSISIDVSEMTEIQIGIVYYRKEGASQFIKIKTSRDNTIWKFDLFSSDYTIADLYYDYNGKLYDKNQNPIPIVISGQEHFSKFVDKRLTDKARKRLDQFFKEH